MFSFFKGKGAAKSVTTIHPEVGAPLVRQASFPAAASATASPARAPRELAIDGVPPQARILDQPASGQTHSAYMIEASGGHAPLALVTLGGGDLHVELWELQPGKPLFARRKNLRLDPEQDSWITFLLSGVAYLPGDRLLLGVIYYAPHVKQALFVYDIARDSYTKIADIAPHVTDRQKLFEAQLVAPNAVIVQYYTNSIRLAPEVYYNTPSNMRLFTPRHPQGLELLQLSAADGSIQRWVVIDKMLWLDALDYRERHKPKEFIWSLDLKNVLPR